MSLTQLPPLDPSSQTFKADVDAFFRGKIQTFVNEVNALQANLNSIAAGGAYAIPYLFSTDSSNIGKGGYFTFPSPNTTANLYLDSFDARGASVSAALVAIMNSTSAIKAQIKVTALGDPSRFFVREITFYANNGTYGSSSSNGVSGSASSLAEGEEVIVQIQRTGDKGDTGAAAINPAAKFSDRKSSGASGGTNVVGEQVRTLNTTDYNTLGATLSGNQVTLPAGTYDITGRAPAHNVGYHRATLYNVSDSAVVLIGSSEYSAPTASVQTSSEFSGRLVLASAKTFSVRHYTSQVTNTTGLGNAVSGSGLNETFTELNITKVA